MKYKSVQEYNYRKLKLELIRLYCLIFGHNKTIIGKTLVCNQCGLTKLDNINQR